MGFSRSFAVIHLWYTAIPSGHPFIGGYHHNHHPRGFYDGGWTFHIVTSLSLSLSLSLVWRMERTKMGFHDFGVADDKREWNDYFWAGRLFPSSHYPFLSILPFPSSGGCTGSSSKKCVRWIRTFPFHGDSITYYYVYTVSPEYLNRPRDHRNCANIHDYVIIHASLHSRDWVHC